MESVTLTVLTFDIINDILNTITGYRRERKVNFTTKLTDKNEETKVQLIYNDTNKVIFEGTVNQDNLIEAVANEDKKEKETKDISE
ncbi:hypothetical protein LCGC14_0368270 [marine sediment metagenome]|uniref:Uncharacterized protein n=1 Tax=marine sediment metagenome TaxID=412755 RepID=A0A0F9T5W2_9ZZZZ